jgi:hypothetical protein
MSVEYEKELLAQVATSAMGPIPTVPSDFGRIVWDAFRAGRDYEKLQQAKIPKVEQPL